MKKRLSALLVLVAILPMVLIAAAGDKVTVSIASTETWSKSSRIDNCTGYVEYDARNSSKSTNSLWAICYQYNGIFPATEYTSSFMGIGKSTTTRWKLPSGTKKSFYLELDPNGAGRTGCIGSGELYD